MSNLVTLNSGEFTATVNPFGAELCSLKHLPSDTEFIWQAEKSIWPRHAPVLFPFVGRLKNFEYQFEKKTYNIEQHGFARDSDFNIITRSENSVGLELKENAYTLDRYPFLFHFKIKYKLIDNRLTMVFEVANTGKSIMPVSFGGHPAFNIINPGDAFIEFENDMNPVSWILKDNFISNQTKSVSDGNGLIFIDKNTFEDDALIFKNLKSDRVQLKSKTTNSYVKVSIKDWPYLGIWAKPGANFICIEPWQGLADSLDFEGDISRKEGIIMLSASERIEKTFEIETGC